MLLRSLMKQTSNQWSVIGNQIYTEQKLSALFIIEFNIQSTEAQCSSNFLLTVSDHRLPITIPYITQISLSSPATHLIPTGKSV